MFFVNVLFLCLFSLTFSQEQHDFWPFLNPLYQKNYWPEWSNLIKNSENISVECKNHVTQIFNKDVKIEKEEDLWVVKMLDSWGKIPSGLSYIGNVDLGQFDECIAIKLNNISSLDVIQGQYCFASFPINQLKNEFPELIKHIDLEILEDINAIKLKMVPGIISPSHIDMGICFPDSCSSQEIELILNSFINLHYKDLQIKVDHCQKDQPVELSGVDIFAVVFIVTFMIFCVICTLYDVVWPKERGYSKILIAFSISNNAQLLLGPNGAPSTFSVLHGLRFFTMNWVVMSHRYLFQATQPSIDLIDTKSWIQDLSRITLSNGDLASDTFFVISGVLLAYFSLKEIYRSGKFDILKFYLHRYIRLTPPFAMMIFTQATLWNYLGSGPYWPSLSGTLKKACEETWWPSLLYINNFNPTNSNFVCIPQSWYLSVDMQLHWISPIILIPLWKFPRVGLIIGGFLIIFSFLVTFTLSEVYDIPGGIYSTLHDMDINYTTYSRFGSFIIGLLVGFVILKAQENKWKINRILLLIVWALILALGLGTLLSVYPFHRTLEPICNTSASFHLSLNRLAWSLFIGWVIFACATDQGGVVNAFLCWDILIPLSKLSYCIFLTSFSVQSVLTFITRTPVYHSDYVMIPVYLGDMTLSSFLSVVWTLFFEVPFINLSRLMLKNKKDQVEINGLLNGQTNDLTFVG